jgi:hypothetical protein
VRGKTIAGLTSRGCSFAGICDPFFDILGFEIAA